MYESLEKITLDVMTECLKIRANGWRDEDNDKYVNCDLAQAAACYALGTMEIQVPLGPKTTISHTIFPWGSNFFQPQSYRENLIRAASLLMAEVARVDRVNAAAAEAARIEASEAAEEMARIARDRDDLQQDDLPAIVKQIQGPHENRPVTPRAFNPAGPVHILGRPGGHVSASIVPIANKIINIRDVLKKRSRVGMRNLRDNLHMLFTFAA